MSSRQSIQKPQTTKGFFEQLLNLLTHDFCPSWNLSVAWLRNPLAVLILAAVASLLVGIFLHPNGFVLMTGILVVLVVGVVWPWLGLSGLRGQLQFGQSRVSAGEPVAVELRVKNRLPMACFGITVTGVVAGDNEPSLALDTVAGWRTTWAGWEEVNTRRGVFPEERVRLRTGFPFGVWHVDRQIDVATELVVWPRTFPVGPVPDDVGEETCEGAVARNRVGTLGDVLGLRPYRRGDVPRRIHWAQSARHDRLIVCELQARSRPVVQIVLDVNERCHVGDSKDSSREWAIRIAASYCRGWLGQGIPVGLAFANEQFPVDGGERQLRRLMDGLARIGKTATSLQELLQTPFVENFRSGVQVVITTDQSLKGLPANLLQTRGRRFVVLRCQGFSVACCSSTEPLPVVPWLEIPDVEHVVTRLLRSNREVNRA